jgi:hypothetical protein
MRTESSTEAATRGARRWPQTVYELPYRLRGHDNDLDWSPLVAKYFPKRLASVGSHYGVYGECRLVGSSNNNGDPRRFQITTGDSSA